MTAISSGSFSHDQQLADAVDWLRHNEPALYAGFITEYADWENARWSGSWIDTEAMGVEPDWASWAADWIEEHTEIYWEDGEPWIDLPSDEMPCGHLRNDYNLDSAGIASACNVCGHSIFDDGRDEPTERRAAWP